MLRAGTKDHSKERASYFSVLPNLTKSTLPGTSAPISSPSSAVTQLPLKSSKVPRKLEKNKNLIGFWGFLDEKSCDILEIKWDILFTYSKWILPHMGLYLKTLWICNLQKMTDFAVS